MKRLYKIVVYQEGTALLMALMVLMVLSLLGTIILSVATMETRVAINDEQSEQARQAADAGVQVARDVIKNYLMSNPKNDPTEGAVIPSQLPDINLGSNQSAHVSIYSNNLFTPGTNSGIVTIKSTGYMNRGKSNEVKKVAEAKLDVKFLPNYPVRCNQLKAVGKYYVNVSNQPVSLDALPEPLDFGGIQNWDTQNWEPEAFETGVIRYPLNGCLANQLTKAGHSFYNPSNQNNIDDEGKTHSQGFTWWIQYAYWLSGLHREGESTLFMAPCYAPQGLVNIEDSDGNDVGYAISSGWFNQSFAPGDEEVDEIFDNLITVPETLINSPYGQLFDVWLRGKDHIYYPPLQLKSEDFIGNINDPDVVPRLQVSDEVLEKCRQEAQSNSQWLYITTTTISPISNQPLLRNDGSDHFTLIIDDLGNTTQRIFIDLPDDNTVAVDFTTITRYNQPITGWNDLDDWLNGVANDIGTFFKRIRNGLQEIVIITPANLEVGVDSAIFRMNNDDFVVFLISKGDIDFNVDPKTFNGANRIGLGVTLDTGLQKLGVLDEDETLREIRTFTLAGNDLNITSTPRKIKFKGAINAGGTASFKIDYLESLNIKQYEKEITVQQDPGIVDRLPIPWSEFGVGKIVSYEYTD